MPNLTNIFDYVKNNNMTKLKKLIKDNPDFDINIKDEFGNYALNYAITLNNNKMVEFLLESGSIIDMKDQDGRSILFNPIKYNFTETIKLLLINNKTNIGVSILDIRDKKGFVPLHYAILFKNTAIVDLLIKNGADVDYSDDNGNNSLHNAVYSGKFEICKIILKHIININAKTNTGENALHISTNHGYNNISDLLIDGGIDINAIDSKHEFTPLHYAVNLNNKKLVKKLIDNNVNINTQDFLGNTALHYATIEETEEIFNILLNSRTININIYNFESKLPMHIVLEKKKPNYYKLLINKTNLNFQDINGNTPLHYLSKENIWTNYKDKLIKKKLNIFITNNEKERPVDFIDVDKITEFIEMVTDSYLYVLKTYNTTWAEDWENKCKKELQTDDLCKSMIKDKLMKLYKKDISDCTSMSYPNKRGKTCVSVNIRNKIELCSFTGITLDVLVGLIYLLRKYNYLCSPLNTEFIENRELCDYYKNIGIKTRTKCEFLNFEIVWINNKLSLASNFFDGFKGCLKNNDVQFIIIPLGIEMNIGSHANYLIYDKKTMEVERFEPYGSSPPYNFNYNPELLDEVLNTRFKNINKNIKYVKPSDFLPKIGFQFFENIEAKTGHLGDPGGFCALWSIWYVDQRMTYKNIKRDKLVKKILKQIKMQYHSFRNLIRDYSTEITAIRDEIFKKANININDWINEQYTEKQITTVVTQISKMINQL